MTLHEFYHRKEGDKYLIGEPQTGRMMALYPIEFQVLQLFQRRLTIKHAEEMLRDEEATLDMQAFLRELKAHGFIHKIDNRIITAVREPLHELALPLKWLGGQSVRFLLVLLSLCGIVTLAFFASIPDFTAFFAFDSLTITLLAVIAFAWLLVGARQLMKYAAAQHLGVQARFGLSQHYHLFLPKTYLTKATEEQEHYIIGTGLLTMLALTSVSVMLSAFWPMYEDLWMLAFAIGVIELIGECLLFLETDLAKFIALRSDVYRLNEQTRSDLKEDWRLLWKGKGKESLPGVTQYSFFYLTSFLVGVILAVTYLIPAMAAFLLLAFRQFSPGGLHFIDAFFALLFFSLDLVFFGFAMLTHHPLAHNKLFVNTSLVAVTVGSFVLATVGIQFAAVASDSLLTVILAYLLGVVVALFFEQAVMRGHPFAGEHDLFERAILPVLAACLPVTILFTIQGAGAFTYLYALFLGAGMLSAVALRELSKTTERRASNNLKQQ